MKFGRNQPRSQPVGSLAWRVRNSWLCFIPGTPLPSSSVSSDTAAVMPERAAGHARLPLRLPRLPKLLLFEHGRAGACFATSGRYSETAQTPSNKPIIADWIIAARGTINLSKWHVMVARAVRLTRPCAQRLSWGRGAVVAICGVASVPAETRDCMQPARDFLLQICCRCSGGQNWLQYEVVLRA